MPEFQKIREKQFPQVQDRETSEAKYWKSFGVTKEEKLLGTPNCIQFNPVSLDTYLVTSSTKVMLYDSMSDKVQRAYSRFTDDAFSGRFRKDGKLIVAGSKDGYVKVFDMKTKAVLRQLKQHTAAVRSTVWASDGLHIISGSDDRKVKLWDLATEDVVWDSKSQHTDYVRCVETSPSNPDIFVSGSYDHSVRIWDKRQAEAASSMDVRILIHCAVSVHGRLNDQHCFEL